MGVAMVTGASRGLGRAIAVRLARSGHRVGLVARTAAQLDAVRDEITHAGGDAVACVADLTDPSAFEVALATVRSSLGPVDVFVANAGVSPVFKPAVEVTAAEFDAIFAVNVRSTFFATTAVMRGMIADEVAGAIVIVGSTGADVPVPGVSAYCASKAAVAHLARVLALEAAPYGIRVNTVNPGYIATDLTAGLRARPERLDSLASTIPLGEVGTPEDVAEVVAFLASDAARYVTGSGYAVDGGVSLPRAWPPVPKRTGVQR